MSGRLTGKVAIVTGGSRGIGRAIAERFVEEGAKVVIGDLAEPERLRGALTGNLVWHRLDVAAPRSVRDFVAAIVANWGGIDVLVNNAGIMFEKSIDEQSEDDWDRMMAINLRGPFLMAKHVVPEMRKRGGGAIVNIGSVEGCVVNPWHTAYAASKAGVHGLTIALAIDLGRDGIRCNAICPGWIDTDLNRAYVEAHPDRDLVVEELEILHPVGRIGDPRDVADTALWLASDESGFVSGQLITVDGARTKKIALPRILDRASRGSAGPAGEGDGAD